LFSDVKIVLSLSNDKFDGLLSADFKQKLEGEGIMDSMMSILEEPSYQNLYRFVIEYADGIIVTSPDADQEIVEYARSRGKRVLDYQAGEDKEVFDNYKKFYDEL
jgi:starch synthase